MTVEVTRVVTRGIFALDGGEWEVDNNVWVVGGDDEALVIDAAHDAAPILAAIGERRLVAVVCTHAHNDHVNAAAEVAAATGAPILLHPSDDELWRMTYPSGPGYESLTDGQVISVDGVALQVIHTPGHSPGAVSLYAAALGALFSGDTLFHGGPGATGRSFSDFPTIIDSIRDRLLTLPPETVVHTGHGDDTTIGTEAPDLGQWLARGH